MNSKAIRKQLLAAVAMVLVAAVALGSSTYAWFVASGSVTATGMSVKAQSEGNLVISYGGQKWGTSATAGMEQAKALKPTSTKDLSKWSHATAEEAVASTADNSTFVDVTTDVQKKLASAQNDANDSEYAVMRRFLIRSASKDASAAAKGLYVESVEVSATKTMSTALRVGVKCGSNFAIFAPVSLGTGDNNTPSKTYDVTTVDGSEKKTTSFTVNDVGHGEATNVDLVSESTVIGNTEAGAAEVFVYIWLEGEDHNLYSDNFYTEDLSVSVNFNSITTNTGASTAAVDLKGASAVTENSVTIGGTPYYEITDKTLNGNKLYTTASGPITSTSQIFTINQTAQKVVNVTDMCTLPEAAGG